MRPSGAAPKTLGLPHVHVLGHRDVALEGHHAGEVTVVLSSCLGKGFNQGRISVPGFHLDGPS